jgi:NitT/TauT family transport system permease protein
MKKKNSQFLWKAAAVLLALGVWQCVSMAVHMEMLLASPLKVLARFGTIWREPGFFSTVLFSVLRILGGFLLAFTAGILLGWLAGRFPVVETLLWPYVVAIKSVPIASFIILCLLWFSYGQLTVFIAFLIAFPVIYSNVLQGLKSTDPRMLEMARTFRVSGGRKLFCIQMPAVFPYLVSASGVAIGMAWKAGVAAEVIGVINGSIGRKLYDAKIYFQNADLLCWTLIIILLSVAGEKLFVFLLRKLYARLIRL